MAEKEYIERGALLMRPPFTKYGGDLSKYTEGYLDCAEEARNAVNDAPAADVVEVVRCKDCKRSNFEKSCSKYRCGYWLGMLRFSNDFCSYGIRKEKTNEC